MNQFAGWEIDHLLNGFCKVYEVGILFTGC